MMYLLFSFVAAAVFAHGTCDQKREEPIDIMFLVDGSSSIGNVTNGTPQDPSQWPGQLHFLKQLIEKGTIEGDRVGMYQFSIMLDDHDDLGQMEYELGTPVDTILNTIEDIEQRTGGTPTMEAISEAYSEFETNEIQGEDRQKLLVIVTDGDPTCRKDAVYEGCHDPCHDLEGNPIMNIRGMLDSVDIKTVVIGVNNEAEKLKCLVEDPEVNIVKISDFQSFEEYSDPTGDDNLLCVNPEELELKCCRASVFSPELKNMYDQNCMKMSYIECVHRRGTILGSCDWGIDTEGDVIEGCGAVTRRPTPEPTPAPTPAIVAVPAPTSSNTFAVPQCCRASVFTEELKGMYDDNCRKMSYVECVHRRGIIMGSCEWGIDTEGKQVEGCNVETVETAAPTPPVPAPVAAPVPQCCRASVFTEDLKETYDNNCRKMSYVECVHRRGTILGSCEWGIDTEGEQVEGCNVETAKPTPAVTAPVTAPEPQCCRASVFTEELKSMYDDNCRKMSYIECVHRRGTILGSCEWGVDTEGEHVEGCATPTPATEKPTAVTTPTPTTKLTCAPLKNCVVKGGVKVIGWVNAGGRLRASSACDCAERCQQAGGTEAKFHVKRNICKCWKQSTHIELKSEPFDANRKHGGNAGGMTECVQMPNSVADITEEKTVTIQAATRSPSVAVTPSPTNEPTSAPTKSPTEAPTKAPTNAPTNKPTKAPTNEPTSTPTKSPTEAPTKSPTVKVTPKPTLSAEECAKKKEAFLKSSMSGWCIWSDTRCFPICA